MIAPQRQAEIMAQKAEVRALRRQIGVVDRNSRRAYIREFHEDFDSFKERASYDDLVVRGFRSDLIYMGDYHALPACQEFCARFLLDMIRRSTCMVLAVEMFYGRQQRLLDEWMAGDLDDAEFLRRTRYQEEWGYDWKPYAAILRTARDAGIPAVALDREPRTGFRHIRQRDTYAAERIAGIFARQPQAKVLALVGESHLARSHLPAKVVKALARQQMEKRSLVIVQNIDALYWQRAEAGMDEAEVVRVDGRRYCVFTATPRAKYEAYRRVLERWRSEGGDDELDLAPTVHGMIETILRFLRVDPDRKVVARRDGFRLRLRDLLPEVYAGEDEPFVTGMMRRHGLEEDSIQQILSHLRRAGSCYVPRINAIFVGAFEMAHAGEEASHFVHFALRGEIYEAWEQSRRPAHEVFYADVMDEAVGYFGSKLIHPARNHFFETDFYRLHKHEPEEIESHTGYTYEEFRSIIDFILLHKKFEQDYHQRDNIPPAILEGIRASGARRRTLTHELGYFLGQQIHEGFQKGLVSHDDIAALFHQGWQGEHAALTSYLGWTEKLAALSGG